MTYDHSFCSFSDSLTFRISSVFPKLEAANVALDVLQGMKKEAPSSTMIMLEIKTRTLHSELRNNNNKYPNRAFLFFGIVYTIKLFGNIVIILDRFKFKETTGSQLLKFNNNCLVKSQYWTAVLIWR